MPNGSWWTDQVKTCKDIDRAWEILDVEFADKRKMMDELLARINRVKSVKSNSVTHKIRYTDCRLRERHGR